MTGTVDNDPCDIPQLKVGAEIAFERHHVVAVDFLRETPIIEPEKFRREFWERCLVDRNVIEKRSLVQYLYREEPDLTGENDQFPDSGWRIRGDDVSIEDSDTDTAAYAALGVVLNAYDSWLHLINAPSGSAFARDPDSNSFVPTN
ncbi:MULTISPECIES: DUF2185 domain-containing protein [Rhizobium]|uniref:immunity protein Imm33 domain-containing protein n=1 Tax=Rhizobium TaxID=379 RepID=UPI00195BFEA5|nr:MULTISPECIES: DUF2185 domain-containing protein [Rhizobium]MBM7044389.1 DUF2185 domain-containing protein [Rhizobium lusitanum]